MSTRSNILITGASSGLGAGMARLFAARGRNLALCARRTDKLDALKAELEQAHPGITVLVTTTRWNRSLRFRARPMDLTADSRYSGENSPSPSLGVGTITNVTSV